MPYQVLTQIGNDFQNVWSTENCRGQSVPQYFDTKKEAEAALCNHLADEKEAKLEGFIETCSKKSDFKVGFISVQEIFYNL